MPDINRCFPICQHSQETGGITAGHYHPSRRGGVGAVSWSFSGPGGRSRLQLADYCLSTSRSDRIASIPRSTFGDEAIADTNHETPLFPLGKPEGLHRGESHSHHSIGWRLLS